MARTVHRLQGKLAIIRFHGKHVVTELVSVAGSLPQRHIHDLRGTNFTIALLALSITHVLLDYLVDSPAGGMPKHHTGCFFLQMKQVKLFTDFAMIALFRFLKSMQITLEILFVSPGSAVNPL